MREKLEIAIERDYQIAKANELIQEMINVYNVTEMKAFCYILSKVKPMDEIGKKYLFRINDFCEVCGINTNDGRTITRLKKALKGLADKSCWSITEDGGQRLVRAIEDVKINKGSTSFEVVIHKSIAPYVLGLNKEYTQYSLLGVVPMRSSYSIKLYELLKSYAGLHRHEFTLEDLKLKLQAPYGRYKDFRVRVLETAIKEINHYTDIEVSWQPIKSGRSVTKIHFEIRQKKSFEIWKAGQNAIDVLDGQMRLNMDGTLTEERICKKTK